MRGFASLDDRACRCRSTGVERDRDDREVEVLEFVVQRLPPGQVKGASSPGGPREQKDFLAAIVRQAMQLAVEVGQLEIGSLERAQRVASLGRLRTEVPYAMLRIAGPRPAHLIGERGEIEPGCAVTLRGELAIASRRN